MGDELSARSTVTFQLSDSLSRTLCGTDSLPPLESTGRWLSPPRMGVARFDSITDAMGGAKAIQVSTSLRRCYVNVQYLQLLNVPGVERAYAALRPHFALPWFHDFRIGGGDDVRIEASGSVWRVRISAGWGDCPSGCIHRHDWEFRYHRASGRIDKVVDAGPPLPPRRNINGYQPGPPNNVPDACASAPSFYPCRTVRLEWVLARAIS